MPVGSPAFRRLALPFLLAIVPGCQCGAPEPTGPPPVQSSPEPPVPTDGYTVVNRFPHDTTAYTEGLEFHNGLLYESTGKNGSSDIRQVTLTTGKIVRQLGLSSDYFGEGITVFGGTLHHLTWQTYIGFTYDPVDFRPIGSFRYTGEGWGMTHDSLSLIMSNGTNRLQYLDPETHRPTRTLYVTAAGQPVPYLNELEYIDGQIYANVWQSDRIARIDPATGRVVRWLNLAGLLPGSGTRASTATAPEVLNGIAYDRATKRLFVTGKYWPTLFEIRIQPDTTTLAATRP